MKHIKPVSCKPDVAQANPNFEAKMTFKVNLTDQAVEFVFQKTS
ncbi:MAG TPA: hypothetical protein PKI11_07215 [Candidatus Hydrogenedentes bacterium]|nr:hypothetical protein [Candidatus Hydrogenedentota bacterium]